MSIKHLLAAFAVLTIVSATTGVRAYFELEDVALWGKHNTKTLADGSLHMSVPGKHQEPLPEAVRAKIEGANRLPFNSSHMHYTMKYEVVMQPHWQVFDLAQHCDMSRLTCHDNGDLNMRLTLFGVSAELDAALAANDKKPVVLHAKADAHTCHGNPIFRQIIAVHKFGDETLLVTRKGRYDEIFDHADVHFEIEHPFLTHIDSTKELPDFDADAKDYGREHFEVPSTAGARAIARHAQLAYPREDVQSEPREAVTGTANNDMASVPDAQSMKALTESRHAQAQWGSFKKAFKKVKKTVKKTVKKVVKKVKKTTTRLVKAAGKGLKAAVNKIGRLFTINVNFYRSMSYTFTSCYIPRLARYCNRNIVGVLFTVDFKFKTRLTFKFKISYNKMKLFYTNLYGGLVLGAAAKTQSLKDGTGQATLLTIQGPKIFFAISIVPVWIWTTFPILGGVAVEYNSGKQFKAGYSVEAGASIGVQWTSGSGFQMLTSKNFRRKHYLKYPRRGPVDITVTPYVACQARFALYSMVVGYPMVTIGLDNRIQIPTRWCNTRVYGKFFIKLSAGLDFELKIKKITIFYKGYGAWDLYKWSRPVYSICKGRRRAPVAFAQALAEVQERQAQTLALPSTVEDEEMEEHSEADAQPVDFSSRAATAQEAPIVGEPTTELTDEDDGKEWSHAVTCSPSLSFNLDVAGYFDADNTLFFVTLSRNVTAADGNYTLTLERFLTQIPSTVTLGLNTTGWTIPATEQAATALGLDAETIEDLTGSFSGNPNVTALKLEYINISFDAANLDIATFSNPNLCGGVKVAAKENGTTTKDPVEPKEFQTLMASLVPQTWEAFIDLITDALAAVLAIAVIEFVVAWQMPRIIGEKFWPKRAEKPRIREFVYGVCTIVIGLLCFVAFLVGGSLEYAAIIGAHVDPKYEAPPAGSESNFLTPSGVEMVAYEFAGSAVEVLHCPQYYPCSPNCRDLCRKETFAWPSTPWPYCPKGALIGDNGGCTKFAWDAVLDAVFGIGFLVLGTVLPLLKSGNIYRRMPVSNACYLMVCMFLTLLWRRMESFMVEVRTELFEPANDMVIPYQLYLREASMKCFEISTITFYVITGINGVLTIHECYSFYKDCKDGRITLLDESTLEESLASAAQAMEDKKNEGVSLVTESASVTSQQAHSHAQQRPAAASVSAKAAPAPVEQQQQQWAAQDWSDDQYAGL